MLYIGIDPGVNTGYAEWDSEAKFFVWIGTRKILGAMSSVLFLKHDSGLNLHVVFEDARQRKWYGSKGREALQGAGSIKRDCAIWQEFCEYHQIPFTMVPPKDNSTKLDAATFKKITGWTGRTNEHGRDAAMLVFGR